MPHGIPYSNTHIYDLLEEFKKQSLQQSAITNETISSQTNVLSEQTTTLSERLSTIELLLSKTSEKDDLIITYPEAGSTEELPVGVAVFDFFGGTVKLPTGIQDDLSDALREHGHKQCHSITIDSEQPVIVRIDNSGAYTTNGRISFSRSNVSFQRISIETDRKTNVKLYASTTPNALRVEPRQFYSNNPFISNSTVDVVGTKNIEDIRSGSSTINGAAIDDTSQCLGENATSGYIYNSGPGNLSIEFHNGVSYSEAETLPSNMTRDFEDMNISKIRIDTTIGGTAYILGAQ